MQGDLKRIKKRYGEKMAHLCRELFSTLLEKEGLLYELISSKFAPNKFLYDDLIEQDKVDDFKNLIYSLYDVENQLIKTTKSPFELMKEAGYSLYECNTNEEILKFKKYYAPWEELCTFRDDRLKRHFVFFAVKDGAEKLNRDDFKKPQREDEYGTSVISIQFTKGRVNTLSIKNRYNHTINNPDATFSNNLDNIIPGLTNSFEETYCLNINSNCTGNFSLDNYVLANDHRYYRYNYEIENIYYCINNIIIDNYEVISDYTDSSKYVVLDYFILDLNSKKMYQYYDIRDSFCNNVSINKNVIEKLDDGNKLIVLNDNIKIIVNKYNQMISYENNEVEAIDNNFLYENQYLKNISIKKVKKIGRNFLLRNNDLENIEAEETKTIDDGFLFHNRTMKNILLPKVVTIGSYFLSHAPIEYIDVSSAQYIGDNFLEWNNTLNSLKLRNAVSVGNNFLHNNELIKSISMPNLINIGDGFLYYNRVIVYLNLPKVESIGRDFMSELTDAIMINMPNLNNVGIYFLYNLKNVEYIKIPYITDLKKSSNFVIEFIKNKEQNKNKILKLNK